MRITGGDLKGHPVPAGFASHVRPTTDIVREALFNKLVHSVGIEDMEVLDLFSGSGIVSLECLSRGAASVISVDKDVKNIKFQQGMKKLKELNAWEIAKADAFRFLEQTERSFNIIFADPPYDMPGQDRLPELALARLSEDGIFVLEHRPGKTFGYTAIETRKYGSTAFSIFAKHP